MFEMKLKIEPSTDVRTGTPEPLVEPRPSAAVVQGKHPTSGLSYPPTTERGVSPAEQASVTESPSSRSKFSRVMYTVAEFAMAAGVGAVVMAKYWGTHMGWTIMGGALIAAAVGFVVKEARK